MMKSILAIILLVATIFALASCVPETPDPPEGVWVSENPRITLFLKPAYRLSEWLEFIGLYEVDGVDVKVFVRFGNGLVFDIHDYSWRCKVTGVQVPAPLLLGGIYRVVGDEIHWSVGRRTPDGTGVEIEIIIFRRVEDYDPIDPYYWSPYFFPRTSSDETAP